MEAIQFVSEELQANIKMLLEVDEDEFHELTDEKRFDEADITMTFLGGVIKACILCETLPTGLALNVAKQIAEKLGFIPEETDKGDEQ